jgi:hypothetical protein
MDSLNHFIVPCIVALGDFTAGVFFRQLLFHQEQSAWFHLLASVRSWNTEHIMGDNMKKVRTGDALDIPAATFNTFIDSARDFLQRQSDQNRQSGRDIRNSGIILMKNGSGSDRERFNVLGIKEPIINLSDNADAFKNRVALTGITPNKDDHTGKFAVLLSPMKTDALGLAMVLGVCPVKITVDNAEHTHADINDGDAATLKSGFYGAAQILWKEDGTGEKWAVVRINAVPTRNMHEDDAEKAVHPQINGSGLK